MLVMKVCRMLLSLDLKDAIDLGNLFAIKVISSDYRRRIEVFYPLAYRFEDDELYELQKKKRKLRVKWLLSETCIYVLYSIEDLIDAVSPQQSKFTSMGYAYLSL